MQTRAAMIQGAIAAAWLLAATANAQPIPTMSLVQPAALFQVSASPSGSLVAGLRSDHGQVFLWVSPLQGGQLRPVVSTYYLGRFHSIDSYRWLNDDYLVLQVENLVNGLQEPVVAGISRNIWRRLPVFSELLQYPWGSDHQALLQESGEDCRAREMHFCLFSLNVDHWGGERISEPLRLLPVDFLPVSPAEIYASDLSVLGQHEEFRLDGQRWHRVADGTVAAQRAQLVKARQPPASMIEAAARVGIRHPTFVLTAPGELVVGVIGRAPEPAFVALDPKLQGLQAFLASHYPDARVTIGGLDDSLTHAQVTVWDSDLPPTTYILQADGRLANYAPADPRLPADRLGQTHRQPVWAQGASVAVTMPPRGVTTLGAVVTPVLAAASDLEDPLHEYRPQVQALAQQGIAVVQVLSPIPAAFANNADGAIWHAAFNARL